MKEKILAISDYCIDKIIKGLLIVVPLLFAFGRGEHYFFSVYDAFKESAVESFAALLAAFFLLKLVCSEKDELRNTPIKTPLLLFLGIIFVSLLQAYNIWEGIFFIRRWVANAVMFFVVFHFVREKKRMHVYLNYLIFMGLVTSAYGVLQWFDIDFPYINQNFIGNSTFGNPNFASEYILLIFPIAFMLMFANASHASFIYYSATSIIMFVFLMLNKTRGVWVGGGVAGIIIAMYLFFAFFSRRIEIKAGKREKRGAVIVLKVLGTLGIVFFIVVAAASARLVDNYKPLKQLGKITRKIGREISTLTEIKLAKGEIVYGDTATQRLLIWRNTLRMIKRNSMLGVGIGNFKIQYQPHRTKEEQISTGPDVFVRRAHNEYVQLLAEIGPLGILSLLSLFYMSLRMTHRMLRESREFESQCLAIGFMAALASSYVSYFFNFALQTPTPCMTLFFVLAMVASSYDIYLKRETNGWKDEKVLRESAFAKWVVGTVIIALFISPYWLVKPAFAYYSYQFGQALERMGLYKRAQLELERSLGFEYHAWETHFVLANTFSAQDNLKKAIKEHEISLALNPYHQKGHYNYGNALYKIGKTDEAIYHYQQAVKIDAVFYQGFNNLGSILVKEKRYGEALNCFRNVTELAPDFPSGQYNMGYILYLMGNYASALPYLEHAYQLKPGDDKILKLIKHIRGQIKGEK